MPQLIQDDSVDARTYAIIKPLPRPPPDVAARRSPPISPLRGENNDHEWTPTTPQCASLTPLTYR